ncbi:uncharacterized protein BYT42DRAFT_579965 [Radiomyces spectabilis]|uniref:uncharacterized protein n=1 Tax=Radiomyces spectabilis TaxID=64574 RepID=UPI00221E9CB6|nr:uncharacterized protein BYT42DRAFT_579965 [Radiomyces spectabilis]KAI8371359.1 hypothetical protein BYT42DRAFT_579965 [Radiomyces spectabilis]
MTCNCGHMMCYVCRKDVRREQYTHFCQHPRDPGSLGCDQCNKCDLWQTERDDAVAKRAGEKARRDYLQAHPELQHAAEDLPQGIGNDIVGNLVKMRKWFHRTRITLLRYILNKLV